MLILNIIVLMLVALFIGYYLGKGKIVITKTMNKEDSAKYLEQQEKMLKTQQEAMDKANRLSRDLGLEV